jgi:hypothetical protein
VEISKASRSRVLACLWSLKHWEVASLLISKFESQFGLPEVLRALQIMDAGRESRALTKKLERLKSQNCKQNKKMGMIKSRIHDLTKETTPGVGPVTSSVLKRIRNWMRSIPADKLEFWALALPKEPWRQLADMIHPKKDDFALPWFLEFVFGADAPNSSLAYLKSVVKEDGSNLVSVLEKHRDMKIPFSFVRTQCNKKVPLAARKLMVSSTPLDTMIWWHDELACPEIDAAIIERLKSKSEPCSLTYGKLMERLLYFKKVKATEVFNALLSVAEEKLKAINLELEAPAVVIGDASSSMQVAVQTATIIASVLSLLTNADLIFFNGGLIPSPQAIKNVEDTIKVAETVRASGCTAPAVGLIEYYKQKKVVKCFVVVTDEEENTACEGHLFADLYDKYVKEVYPAKLVFVSFLHSGTQKGQMVVNLEAMGYSVMLFRLDSRRPDLQKMDSLLGLLSSESEVFSASVTEMISSVGPLLSEDEKVASLIRASPQSKAN